MPSSTIRIFLFRPLRLLPVLLVAACSPSGPDSDSPSMGTQAEKEDAAPVLQVAAVLNETDFQIRFRFETDNPVWYHQYWVYRDGDWVRYGSGAEGPDEHGLYEDRISVMWDDGSVLGFAERGGFVAAHPGMRSTSGAAPAEEVRDHPHLGETLGRSDVRKFILESREADAPPAEAWRHVRPADELESLREEGVFLDLWQWRAHRSHPLGYADNGYVLEYRHSSSGRSMYATNQDSDTELPRYMFDPEQTGFRALDFDKLVERAYEQDDLYYLAENSAAPFDPDHDWRDGDAIPHRILRQPEGSRGAIRASGGHQNGAWRIRLTRSLEAPDPLDSKDFIPGEIIHAAFAVHAGGTGARHHWVSLPVSIGMDTDGDIIATRVDGDLDEVELDYTAVPLFIPPDIADAPVSID